jgi:ubiquinone biosynthesis O-methyltransferase
MRILDVGCGGGIFSLALARLGADVTGLDASEAGVRAASARASLDPALSSRARFVHSTIEDFSPAAASRVEGDGLYDAVVASEVAEHVADAPQFLAAAAARVSPRGGVLFVTTINRTPAAFAAAIGVAEYVLRLAPPGTHEYVKFLTPEEVARAAQRAGLRVELTRGLFYDPLSAAWSLCESTQVNFALVARRDGAA